MQDHPKDYNFPKTTIGRSQRVAPSHDPLTAHHLLPSTASEHSTSYLIPAPSPPRYVPYTPRQRVVTTPSAPVNPSIVVSSLPPSHGGAEGKPQLQSLKAAAQAMNLDAATIGWNILDKLVGGGEEGPEWDEIWRVISRGQVIPTSCPFESHTDGNERTDHVTSSY